MRCIDPGGVKSERILSKITHDMHHRQGHWNFQEGGS